MYVCKYVGYVRMYVWMFVGYVLMYGCMYVRTQESHMPKDRNFPIYHRERVKCYEILNIFSSKIFCPIHFLTFPRQTMKVVRNYVCTPPYFKCAVS